MRGFWAEERVEGGLWHLSNPLFRAVYDYFKRREAEFLTEADHIISLTEAGERILIERRSKPGDGPPITVIPCCVDFDAFPAITKAARAEARRLLGIPPSARVVAYLGSFGTWYLADEMFAFFRVQLERDPGGAVPDRQHPARQPNIWRSPRLRVFRPNASGSSARRARKSQSSSRLPTMACSSSCRCSRSRRAHRRRWAKCSRSSSRLSPMTVSGT